MRVFTMLLVTTALLCAGCKYEVPLTKEHTIPVDSSVLGLWEALPEEGKEADTGDRMMILKCSDTEYLLHYPVENDGLYYRGYPIALGGRSYIQLQVIGTDDGPPKEDEKELFHVASYQLMDGELEIKTLNTDLVDDNLKTTAALVEAFLNHKDNKELFTNLENFRRIKE